MYGTIKWKWRIQKEEMNPWIWPQAQQNVARGKLVLIDELAMTIEALQVKIEDQSVCNSQKALWNDELASDHAFQAFLGGQIACHNLDIVKQQPSFLSPPFCVQNSYHWDASWHCCTAFWFWWWMFHRKCHNTSRYPLVQEPEICEMSCIYYAEFKSLPGPNSQFTARFDAKVKSKYFLFPLSKMYLFMDIRI